MVTSAFGCSGIKVSLPARCFLQLNSPLSVGSTWGASQVRAAPNIATAFSQLCHLSDKRLDLSAQIVLCE